MLRGRTKASAIWTTPGLAGLAIGLLCASGIYAQTPAAAVPLAIRIGGDAANTRVVVDSDVALSGKIVTMDSGRIVLSFSGQNALEEHSGGGLGLVKAWRLAPKGDGASLSLAVAPDALVRRRFVIAPLSGGRTWRYVIDIGAGPPPFDADSSLAPSAVSTAANTDVPTAPPAPLRANRRPRGADAAPTATPAVRKVVVIDAGHGGHDPGAQSSDANEKDITLAAALALRTRLERTGHYKVVMTRATDIFIPLETRVQIARRAGADLFIALHADSAGADTSPHGASVYTLSDHGETRVGEVLGRDEWFTRTGGRSGDPEVGRILLDLTQRSTKNRSAIFAALLVNRLTDRIDLLPNCHRDAGYFVLLAPDVPAVLLEMGFITSPVDETRLTDPVQRTVLMDAVAEAIDAYFTGQTQLAQR
jgi:N-acetylmuramoyl-L-alanine amidase